MTHGGPSERCDAIPTPGDRCKPRRRLLADGGRAPDDEGESAGDDGAESDAADDGDTGDEASDVDASNVEVTEAGEAEPADPKWENPDLDDIPDVEGPKTRPAKSSEAGDAAGGKSAGAAGGRDAEPAVGSGVQGDDVSEDATADPTAGMPNTARSPSQSRLKEGGADGYVVALELCARLPDEVRLPDEAADLVPVALEAELEQDVQSFAAEEFDNPAPHVQTLDFVEADDELWLRLRLGIDPDSFDDLDPDEIRDHALQKLEGMF